MRIIGLTGGIACGKSTVAGWLKEIGAAIIDADAISRELTGPAGEALPAIREAFGEEIFNENGTLDRAALASRVFADPAERQKLNGIVHPLVNERIQSGLRHCRETGATGVILEVPLLYEAGMESLADEVWCVSATEEEQVKRLKARDGLSRKQAISRIRSQWPLAEKELRADTVIHTDGPLEELRRQVAALYKGEV